MLENLFSDNYSLLNQFTHWQKYKKNPVANGNGVGELPDLEIKPLPTKNANSKKEKKMAGQQDQSACFGDTVWTLGRQSYRHKNPRMND